MIITLLEKEIRKLLSRLKTGISFSELSEIQGFLSKNGEDGLWYGREDYNIFLWFNMTLEAGKIMDMLIDNQEIELKPTSFLVYLHDGKVPKIPIAKSVRKYKSERWLPTVINITKNFSLKEY
jgi:hypothetical protein